MNSVMTEMKWTKAPVLWGLPRGTMGYLEIHEVHVGILFMKHKEMGISSKEHILGFRTMNFLMKTARTWGIPIFGQTHFGGCVQVLRYWLKL